MSDEATAYIPRFRGIPLFPRPSSAAWLFGRYCEPEIALDTFFFASRDTAPDPLTTRDTVAVETPASLAISITVHDRTFRLSIDMRLRLEIQPGAEQQIARRQGGRGLSKSSILQVRIDAIQVDAIEKVEEIDPEFKVYVLSNLRDFLYGEVGVGISRISELVRRFAPLFSERG